MVISIDWFSIEDIQSTVLRIETRQGRERLVKPPTTIERCVNAITGKPTDRLADVIRRFVESQFLYDYLDQAKLLMRLNQVMKRVGLTPLPPEVGDWLPRADKLVESRRQRLLSPPDASQPFPNIPIP